MKARVVRMYCERLEEIIEGLIGECENLTEGEWVSDYQEDRLRALQQLARDLSHMERVDDF